MRRSAPALTLLLLVLAVGLAACGGADDKQALPETMEGTTAASTTTTTSTTGNGGKGDAAAGKGVFASGGCGSCHALSDAGASGAVGPNLDETKPSYDLVVDRVTNGKGVMPSFEGQLDEKQIQDVSAYVVEATSG